MESIWKAIPTLGFSPWYWYSLLWSGGIGDGKGIVPGKRAFQGRDLGADQLFWDFTLGSTVVAPGEGVIERVGGRLTSLERGIIVYGITEGLYPGKSG